MSPLRIPALFLLLAGCGDSAAAGHAKAAAAFLADFESAELRFFQLDPRAPSSWPGPRLQGWLVLREKALDDPAAVGDLREILGARSTYGSESYECFTPWMGVRFTQGGRSADLLLSLECRRVRIHADAPRKDWQLGEAGVEKLDRLYRDHALPLK